MVDGELTFFESGAMLLHLGERCGVEKCLWPAAGGQARADATRRSAEPPPTAP